MLRVAIVLTVAGCATVKPPGPSPIDRWWRDLVAYEEHLQRFAADSRQLREEFVGLEADPSFPAVEAKVRDLAARHRAGERVDATEVIVKSLYAFSLAELLVFQKLLALSTRMVTLEAAQAELESARMELRLRRFLLERQPPPGAAAFQSVGLAGADPSLVDQPVALLLTCVRYPVGSLELASCQ